MTAATVKVNLPEVSHVIARGSKTAPRGEVYFRSNPNLVVAFERGRVWRKRGGFGIREEHFRSAYAYLINIGVAGYKQFARDRVGKPSS